jgi:hypothetical protein
VKRPWRATKSSAFRRCFFPAVYSRLTPAAAQALGSAAAGLSFLFRPVQRGTASNGAENDRQSPTSHRSVR